MTEMLPISSRIWDMKYRLKAADGTPIDGTIEDSWRRVARALASAESEPERWEPVFYEALRGSSSCPPAASSPAPVRSARSRSSTAS